MSNSDISAQGVLRISRVDGDRILFNSPFKHSQYITLTIFPAWVDRSLSATKVYPTITKPIIKISLSYSQFAQAITTLNLGEGTPCTIDRVLNKDINPLKEGKKEKDLAEEELDETSLELINEIKEFHRLLKETKLTKSARANLEGQVSKLESKLKNKLPFITERYKEYLERATQQAKTEFSAWVEMQGYKKPKELEGD